MSQEGKKDIQEIQNGIIQECSIVSKCFFRLSKFFEQLGILNKEKQNNNALKENNDNLDNLPSNFNSINNSENLNSEETSKKKSKESPKENKIEEKNKLVNDEIVPNPPPNRQKKQKEIKYLKKISSEKKNSQQKNLNDKHEKKINNSSNSLLRKKKKLNNHIQNKKIKKDKPLKDIGYGRVLPVICYKGDIKIHGYKVQVKYYNSFYSLGPFEDYKFSYELKLYLLNELSNFHCTKENYEKVIENVFKEIEASIYEEHPKLSQKPKDENKNIGNVEN